MLGTIYALAKEPKEAEAGAKVKQRSPVISEPTSTQAAPPAAPAGNAAAGKALFSAQGCNACHTLTAAGSTAKVGPDLDNVGADAQKANRGTVDQYIVESIKDPAAYVAPGYPNGVMPTTFGSTLSAAQINDLVAFITSGKS